MKMHFNLQFLLCSKILVLSMMWVSCDTKDVIDYEYQDQFEEYINKYHGQNLEGKSTILFAIPVNSCSPCVKLLLEKISIMENPKVIAIAWGDTEKDFIPYKTTTSGITILSLDVVGNYMWYDLGIFAPRVLKYINGELMYMEKLSPGNIEEVFDILEL